LRRLLLALLLAPALAPPSLGAQAPAAPAQAAPAEVGLDEKLGQRIPLDLVLKAEDGSPVTLRSLVDRPTILTLNYYRCAGICTPLLAGVAEVVQRTQAEPGKDFKVVTVSFDDRDTPEIAATKRTNYLREVERPIQPEAWRFLTGDAQTTKALCDSVGFRFRREGDDFIHPGVIIFLSPDGMVTRYMYGTTFLPADLQAAVGEAARRQPTPTITKLLKICFSYDPVGRKYVFSSTKAGALLVLAGALAFVIWLVRPRRKATLQTGDSK
jgi:protein SCO1/2